MKKKFRILGGRLIKVVVQMWWNTVLTLGKFFSVDSL